MHTHHDAKTMAQTLRDECSSRGLKLTSSESLEIVARQFGLKNWNVLAAKMKDSSASEGNLHLPHGWTKSGSAAHLYEMGVEADHSGYAVIRRTSDVQPSINGVFGTLMQVISASEFIGRQISFQGELRTQDIVGSATMWMRVDDKHGKRLEFNNLENNPVDGSLKTTQDWTARRIVLQVPDEAATINFGFYLNGFGVVWGRNFSLSPTDEQASIQPNNLPKAPLNLGFRTA